MKRTTDRQTIVRRLIEGEAGSNPPMPVIWGISATIERFTRAMGEVTDRNRLTNVAVDIERVRASGLVKDEIGLDQPDEQGTFSTTLLREAVRTTLSYRAALGGVLGGRERAGCPAGAGGPGAGQGRRWPSSRTS